MHPEEHVVVTENLTRVFGRFTAVDRVSLSVRAGEIFGFIGPNGAGKSTTIKMLCGILTPTSGSAKVGGYDVAGAPDRIRRIIGYMSQRFSLYEDLRAEENLEFFGGIQDLDDARLRRRVQWAMDGARLGEYRREYTRNLPGGVRQRLALACAMIHEPPILFLDEPTAGVDPAARRDFWELIHELSSRGVTVFVSTHYMDEAEHCDRLALIDHGRLVAAGSPREVKALDRSAVLEIEAEDLLGALELLSELPCVLDATLYGNKLHAVVREADAARSSIMDAARARGHKLGRVSPIAPSLEDVFVSLLEGR